MAATVSRGRSSEPLVLRESVDCGAVLTARERDEALAGAHRIEAAGFHSLWVGDHISFHFPILESLTLLGLAAAATERVALGTSVYLLGRPDDCQEQLQGLVDAGYRSFVLSPLGPRGEFVERAQGGLLGALQQMKPRIGRTP